MIEPRPWIRSEYYDLTDPLPSPMMFGGYKLLASKASCRKCGRWFTQALRIELVRKNMTLGTAIPVPMPSEDKLANDFMLKACDNGVGCWNTCRPWKHLKVCQMPSVRLILRHNPQTCGCAQSTACTCPPGCGNQGVYPCRCGRAFGLHKGEHQSGCPAVIGGNCECREFGHHREGCAVGLVKRHSSFSVEYVRSTMALRAKA